MFIFVDIVSFSWMFTTSRHFAVYLDKLNTKFYETYVEY